MQIHQTEASADVGLRSPHRLSGFISAIVHAIDADKPWNRGALNRLRASRKIWQRDAERRGNSKVCQTVFLYPMCTEQFCRSSITTQRHTLRVSVLLCSPSDSFFIRDEREVHPALDVGEIEDFELAALKCVLTFCSILFLVIHTRKYLLFSVTE